MNKELFSQPAITPEQLRYDTAVKSINENLSAIVRAAFEFDWRDDGQEFCFQKQAEFGSGMLRFDRNLSTTTQRIFGIRIVAAEANVAEDVELIRVSITACKQPGPCIASKILQKHQASCSFTMPSVRDLNDGEMICEDIWDRLLGVRIRLFDETLEQLSELKAAARTAADEVLQIVTMCKLTDDFTPYYDYLKNWDNEQTS